jgi:GDP-4-dehydro-6-deoxy-D-mannose reductase
VGYSLLDLTRRLIAASGLEIQLQFDKARTGNSTVRRFIGHPGKLESLGLTIVHPDMDKLLPAMLHPTSARQP